MVAEIDKSQGEPGRGNPAGTGVRPPAARLSKYKQLINLDYTVQNWEASAAGKGSV